MHSQPNNRSDDEEEQGSISLDRILYAVRKRWLMIASVFVLASLMAVGVVMMLPSRYDASAVVQIDPRKKTISNLDGVLSELKADGAVVDSEAEIIRSRSIVLQVIEILDLRNDPEFTTPSLLTRALQFVGLAESKQAKELTRTKEKSKTNKATNKDPIAALLGPKKIGATNPEKDEVAVAFLRRLKVTRVRKTLLINIRFSSRDPVQAARIANTVAEVYLNEQLAEKQRAAGMATGALRRKLDDLRIKLANDERKVEAFKAKNDIFNSEGQILSEKHLARLQEQTVIARNNTASSRAKYLQAKQLRERGQSNNAIADVLESHTVRLLKEQHAKATRKYAELRTKYGPRHPAIKKVQAEVTDAQRQLSREISRLVTNLKNEYEIAVEREAELAVSLKKLKADQVEARRANVGLQDLEREAATSKQLFESLLARYKQTSETQSLQLPDARIVEQADAPLFPAAPKKKRLVLIAAVGGLLAGLALALALEFATLGIGLPEDVEQVYELSHISSLPSIGEDEQSSDPLQNVRLMLTEPKGSFAESVRNIRREIDINRNSPTGSNVLLVAASLPGEGSSLTASNLAHHYALTGNRVLLIDADLRFKGLSNKLSPERGLGLCDILASGRTPEHAILRDATTGLHFMPAASRGPLTESGPELISGPRMPAILAHLRTQFDTIIIDGPPLLPVIDSRILADYADQIVFVTMWRKTPKQLAKKALKTLFVNQQKILGVVVNQVAQDLIDSSRGITHQRQTQTLVNAAVNPHQQGANAYVKAA